MTGKEGCSMDHWDHVYQKVICEYSDTDEIIRDYKGGEIGVSYIEDYYFVSLPRFQFVCDLVSSHLPPGSSVLEVGPGYGFILLSLKERGYPVSGAELAENIPAYSKALMTEQIPVHPFDIERDSVRGESSQYDLVIASEVLEHLHMGLDSSIQKILSLCRTGGMILITVPSLYRVESYLKILCRENISEDFPEIDGINISPFADLRTHPREPTMKDLTRAVNRNNLDVVRKGYFSSSLKAKYPHFSSFVPSPFREHLFVLATKR